MEIYLNFDPILGLWSYKAAYGLILEKRQYAYYPNTFSCYGYDKSRATKPIGLGLKTNNILSEINY